MPDSDYLMCRKCRCEVVRGDLGMIRDGLKYGGEIAMLCQACGDDYCLTVELIPEAARAESPD